jgi:beta-hydroxylase
VDELLLQRTRIPNLQDISEDTRSLTQDDEWKTYVMVVMGTKVEGNCRRCPKTMDAVKRIPGLRTAIFSILGPGKHIPEHRGYFNGLLRYHLGLMVPGKSGDCRIRVGKEVGHWEDGKSLIFDDTYQHEAWNDSDHDRVVLYIDFLRPMKFPMSLISKAFISIFARPFVKEGKRKIMEWEEQYVRLATPPHASADRGYPR